MNTNLSQDVRSIVNDHPSYDGTAESVGPGDVARYIDWDTFGSLRDFQYTQICVARDMSETEGVFETQKIVVIDTQAFLLTRRSYRESWAEDIDARAIDDTHLAAELVRLVKHENERMDEENKDDDRNAAEALDEVDDVEQLIAAELPPLDEAVEHEAEEMLRDV